MHLRLLWRYTLDWCGHLLFHRGWGITGSDGNSGFRGNWKLLEKERGGAGGGRRKGGGGESKNGNRRKEGRRKEGRERGRRTAFKW